MPVPASTSPPPLADQPVDLRGFEQAENFPVALRLLPRQVRQDLRAVYDVVRTIDELGDGPAGQVPGGRTAALQDFAADLGTVWSGDRPRTPVLVRLVPVVRRRNLPQDPFDRLVRANLQDQEVTGYRTFEDLLGYCALSAAPIGELVLTVFGAGTAGRRALSERVCAALQVVEHLQDVAEDRRAGRVYLPAEDLAAAGVDLPELDAPSASPQLRRLIADELVRVEELLDAGPALVGSLRGWARVAVAGYVAGGRAAVDAVRRTGGDVLGRPTGVRRRDVLRHVAGTLRAARRAAR